MVSLTNHHCVRFAIFTRNSITGTSVKTPSVVANAAGDVVPNRAIATATTNSKKLDALNLISPSVEVFFLQSGGLSSEILHPAVQWDHPIPNPPAIYRAGARIERCSPWSQCHPPGAAPPAAFCVGPSLHVNMIQLFHQAHSVWIDAFFQLRSGGIAFKHIRRQMPSTGAPQQQAAE